MRGLSVLALAIAAYLAMAACSPPAPQPANTPMPVWMNRQIQEAGEYPPVVLHVTYHGQPGYQTTATDRADTGDEHGLYAADGRLICRFGGWSPGVTSGACEVNDIIYMGKLYEPEFLKRADRLEPRIGSRLWVKPVSIRDFPFFGLAVIALLVHMVSTVVAVMTGRGWMREWSNFAQTMRLFTVQRREIQSLLSWRMVILARTAIVIAAISFALGLIAPG